MVVRMLQENPAWERCRSLEIDFAVKKILGVAFASPIRLTIILSSASAWLKSILSSFRACLPESMDRDVRK